MLISLPGPPQGEGQKPPGVGLPHRYLLIPYVTRVFPRVEKELGQWKDFLRSCPGGELKKQALASMRHKRFHCQGGSFYALYNPGDLEALVPLIVALQTISDYLDNLCDRAAGKEEGEDGFRRLHLALTHALDPPSSYPDYYSYYSLRGDGGYLKKLVQEANRGLSYLPSYPLVQEKCLELASLYIDLQVYKHLGHHIREELLRAWFKKYQQDYPGLQWWEFSAASGSTLGLFMLLAAARDRDLKRGEVEEITAVYFPWICGLHILLDYYIDQQEDRQHGDLNFVSYYRDREECQERLEFFLGNAQEKAWDLPRKGFHLLAIKGLLAMYLSDPKAQEGGLRGVSGKLIRYDGLPVIWLYRVCRLLRRLGFLN